MKSITIPKRFGYPTVDIAINGKEETFQSGVEISVDDSVAEIIENAMALEPKVGVSRNKLAQLAARTITEVTLDDLAGVTEIPSQFFSGCSNLVRAEIPSCVTSIAYRAFTDCTSLERVVIHATTPPAIQSGIFTGCPLTCKFVVPKESLELYKTADIWSTLAKNFVAIEE